MSIMLAPGASSYAHSQQLFSRAGTYTFVVPAGVTSISAVCVGGGGRPNRISNTTVGAGIGGGGGALAWVNNIPVTPGESLTVVVGAFTAANNTNGANSYIKRDVTSLVEAGGGLANGTGGSVIVGEGSNGGSGINGAYSRYYFSTYYLNRYSGGGGGGAGGYGGVGGGGTGGRGLYPTSGPYSTSPGFGGNGGGVGLRGVGVSGANGIPGLPGTDGSPGSVGKSSFYGAGGGNGSYVVAVSISTGDSSMQQLSDSRNGTQGAVRIVWPGDTRLFPDTNVFDVTVANNESSPVIGNFYEGGIYAGNILVGETAYKLIMAPKLTGDLSPRQWKTTQTTTIGTTSIDDGLANTAAMDNTDHPAAYAVSALTINGYSDWYIPSKNELKLLWTYKHLYPSEELNAQERYWSSTEDSSTSAWGLNFFDGLESSFGKDGSTLVRVRAVRRVPYF